MLIVLHLYMQRCYIIYMAEMTLDEIDMKLEQLRAEKKQRLALQKRREIRRKAMNENSFRNVENQMKYMLGGMILSVWGKKKSVETLEKSPALTDYQKSVIEKFREHYKEVIAQEEKLFKENTDAQGPKIL